MTVTNLAAEDIAYTDWKLPLLLIFCICILLTACSTTRLSGVVDPSYRDNFQAKNIVVVGVGMPIDEQKALEETFEKSFSKYDVEVLRGLEMFPPTRDYSDQDIFKISRNQGADTILIVSASGRDVSETHVPPIYHPGKSTSYISGYGNFATVETYTSPGYTTGGYNIRKPRMNVNVYLKNTKNRETVWAAEGFSTGNAFASFYDLIVSVANTSVKELANEGLISEKIEETPQENKP